MKKKLLSVLLVGAMAFSLTASTRKAVTTNAATAAAAATTTTISHNLKVLKFNILLINTLVHNKVQISRSKATDGVPES